MVETEFWFSHLRGQVRDLQSLLNYLESRETVVGEDYAFLHARLGEVIGRLKDMERWSARQSGASFLRAVLN